MHHVMIQPRVKLGNNVFVWTGAMIGHHSEIGDDCWLTSSANISGSVSSGRGCFFAVNSTIGNNVIVVTQPTDDEQVFVVESTKPFRLNSRQFLRMSRFPDL
jgi:UDP-3-O-[3-hydroxymyristoyl] glucosamine N-acyltransferase